MAAKRGASSASPKPGPKPLAQLIGRRIRELRTERGWTMRELSGKLGVPLTTLTAYEKGRSEPPLRTILKAARLFEVPVELLVSDETAGASFVDAALLDRLRRMQALGEPGKNAAVAILDALLSLRKALETNLRENAPAAFSEIRTRAPRLPGPKSKLHGT